MSLNATELARIVELLDRELRGAIVRKALCPAADDRIALELRTPGSNHYLQIVLAAKQTRLARLEAKPQSAPAPHPFVMLLRGQIHGMRVRSITQQPRDRVVYIDLVASDRAGRLVCELTSRHANLFLLDEGGRVSGSFHPNRSTKRDLSPGQVYRPPEANAAHGIPEARFDVEAERLEQTIEAHYAQLTHDENQTTAHDQVRKLVSRVEKKLRRLEGKLEVDLAAALEADHLSQKAYVLQANLARARKGLAALEAQDFEGRPCTIPLDPKLGPVENMQRMFDKAKRLRRAAEHIFARQSKIETDLSFLRDTLTTLETADSASAGALYEAVLQRFPKQRTSQRSTARGQPARRSPFYTFGIAHGRSARVGRSAADNDTLTLKHAQPDDLWLHVRGRPGSHVVVPLGRGESPSPELLIDGALLAAHFSEARGERDVEVTYTLRRYVQKPRGAAPGAVRLLKEKTIQLRVDPDRLKRLVKPEAD